MTQVQPPPYTAGALVNLRRAETEASAPFVDEPESSDGRVQFTLPPYLAGIFPECILYKLASLLNWKKGWKRSTLSHSLSPPLSSKRDIEATPEQQTNYLTIGNE